MKIRLSFLWLSAILIFGLMSSCGHSDTNCISEGVIEYDATVVDQSNPMASLAPNKMSMHFKNDRACAEMSAGMGLFSTSFISDPEAKTLTQLVKLLNKKLYLVQQDADIKKEIEQVPMEITPTKEYKMIAGYKCQKSHVKLLDSGMEFDVYHTKDLHIKDPNFCNPFYKIDGVLMEYQIKKFNLEMKFTAKAVKHEEIDDATFEVPADYKATTPQEMNELFQNLQ